MDPLDSYASAPSRIKSGRHMPSLRAFRDKAAFVEGVRNTTIRERSAAKLVLPFLRERSVPLVAFRVNHPHCRCLSPAPREQPFDPVYQVAGGHTQPPSDAKHQRK